MPDLLRSPWAAFTVACLVLVQASCAGGPAGPDPIRTEEDSCAFCRMHIAQPRFAAEILGEDGIYLKFDDIGCFRNHLKGNPSLQGAPAWVMDYASGAKWVDARTAHYALEAHEPTPMGFGILAFADRSVAQQSGGRVATFEDMMGQEK